MQGKPRCRSNRSDHPTVAWPRWGKDGQAVPKQHFGENFQGFVTEHIEAMNSKPALSKPALSTPALDSTPALGRNPAFPEDEILFEAELPSTRMRVVGDGGGEGLGGVGSGLALHWHYTTTTRVTGDP